MDMDNVALKGLSLRASRSLQVNAFMLGAAPQLQHQGTMGLSPCRQALSKIAHFLVALNLKEECTGRSISAALDALHSMCPCQTMTAKQAHIGCQLQVVRPCSCCSGLTRTKLQLQAA